jgi:hypothetical protein
MKIQLSIPLGIPILMINIEIGICISYHNFTSIVTKFFFVLSLRREHPSDRTNQVKATLLPLQKPHEGAQECNRLSEKQTRVKH